MASRVYSRSIAKEAAKRLAVGRLERRPLKRLPVECRPQTEAEGYVAQEAVHDVLIAAGREGLAGYKIGCTTPVMQAYLGIGNPCAGGVFSDTVHHLDAEIRQEELIRIGVECELAVILGSDLSCSGLVSISDVASIVQSVCVAIEIVEDRYVDYPSLDTPTLIADDFFGAGCVLGEPRDDWQQLDLSAVSASMSINSVPVGAGTGADILGEPLEALRWLAEARTQRGLTLRAGEFVLLGSLVQTNWVGLGDVIVVESPELGTATAHVI